MADANQNRRINITILYGRRDSGRAPAPET
jgi:hypothetical protein